MTQHVLNLLGLAAVDSINLLAFAVIAGLWLAAGGRSETFAPRAVRFTGGAFCGIVLLSVVSVWMIGNNQELVRALLANLWVLGLLGVLGIVLTVLGLRQSPSKEPPADAAQTPLARGVLQRYGIAVTGVVLGIVQSGTSVPFVTGMVLISFEGSDWWVQLGEVIFFALVAIAPSVGLIVALSRVHPSRMTAATARINGFLSTGRVLGRGLTIVVGLVLVVFSAVRSLQVTGVI